MVDKSEEETNHLITNQGFDAAANDNTQEVTALFDTLCHSTAVVTLSL